MPSEPLEMLLWLGLALPRGGGSGTRGTGVGMQERGGLLPESPALGPWGQGTAFCREGAVSGVHCGEVTGRGPGPMGVEAAQW